MFLIYPAQAQDDPLCTFTLENMRAVITRDYGNGLWLRALSETGPIYFFFSIRGQFKIIKWLNTQGYCVQESGTRLQFVEEEA